MEHGLEDEDNADGSGVYDPSTVDVHYEEGDTDLSQAVYDKCGYLTVLARYLGRINAGRIGSGSRAARTTTSDVYDDCRQNSEYSED